MDPSKKTEEFYDMSPTKGVFYRKPLPEYLDYIGWVSNSGFTGMKKPSHNGLFKSALPGGVNMAWRRDAVANCPLAELYKRSKKGLWLSISLRTARRKGDMTPTASEDPRRLRYGISSISSRLPEAEASGMSFGFTMTVWLITGG